MWENRNLLRYKKLNETLIISDKTISRKYKETSLPESQHRDIIKDNPESNPTAFPYSSGKQFQKSLWATTVRFVVSPRLGFDENAHHHLL